MKKFMILLLVLPHLLFTISNDSELQVEQAWEAWKVNDLNLVEDCFTNAIDLDETNFRAYLGLSMLYNIQEKPKQGWQIFEQSMKYTGNIYPYLYGSIVTKNMVHNIKNDKSSCLKFVHKIADEGDSTGVLQAILNDKLANYYKTKNRLKKAQEYVSKTNTVANWMLIGPYENISASGFDAVYPPELKYEPYAKYPGKEKVPTFWFQNTANPNFVWIDFMMHFGSSDAIYYANSFVYSPTRQTVEIRSGTSGSLKIFLNDENIFEIFDENNNGEDSYIVETELQEGWNRLLIKTGHSEISSCNFYARITNSKGLPIEGLEYSLEDKQYISKPNAPAKTIENFAFKYFKEQIELHPAYPENYIMLATSYFMQDKAIEAELILKDALKIIPDCSLVYYYLNDAYGRGEKDDELSTNLEKLYELNSTIPRGLNYKFNKYVANKEYDKAEEIMKKIKQYSDEVEYYSAIIQYYAERELYDKLLLFAEEAYDKYPDLLNFAYLKAIMSIDQTKKYDGAKKIIKTVLKKHYSTEALSYLAKYALKEGDLSAWKKYMDKTIKLAPNAPGYRINISNVYLDLRNYQEAEQYLKQAIDIAPSYGPYWAKLGQIYRHANKPQKAIMAFENAIIYDNNDYASMDNIRELQDKESVFNCFEINEIDELSQNTPTHEEFPDDNSLIIFKDTKRVVYPSGGSEVQREIMIKVFDQEGIENFQEYSIGYNPYKQLLNVEEAIVIKKDGSRIKGDISRNTIVFKTLEADDILYLKWKLEYYQSGEMFDHFWDMENLSFFIPSLMVRYSLLVPKTKEFQYKNLNTDLEPKVSEVEEFKLYTWENRVEAAIDPEAYMPNNQNIGKVLFISSIPDWNFIVNWYENITKNKTRSTYEITETVNEIFKNEIELTQMQKIQKIYEYIIENITYSSVSFRQSAYIPQKARDVLVNRIGDCKDVSALSIAMLKEIGVEAHFVLADTYNYASAKNQLPSISAFSHCIVAVETEEGIKYLDHTAQNLDFTSIPSLMIDGSCLPIIEDQKNLIFLSKEDSKPEKVIRNCVLTINDDNSILINATSQKTANLAAGMRRTYRYKNQKDREKHLTEILANEFPTVKLLNLTLNNLDSLSYEMNYNYDYEVPEYIIETGKFHILKIPWADAMDPSRITSYEKRTYPIIRWSYVDNYDEQITVKLPGLKPVDLNDKYEFDSVAGKYLVTFRQEGDDLICTRKLDIYKRDILPEEYLDFKEFYNNIVKTDGLQILLEQK